MKYFLIFLVLIGFAGFASAEETFSGHSSIDPPVSEIMPRKSTAVTILFQYTTGPYALTELMPNVQITPDSASKFVKIDVESIEIKKGEIRRIPITITVDQNIEHEKIFLSISFSGNHFQTNSLYKSSWVESVALDIMPKDVIGFALGDCKPIEIDYNISGGKTVICKSQSSTSVKAFVDAKTDGTIALDIPKHVLYGISSTDCRLDNDFPVLYDGEEIAADITEKNDSNLVSVDFDSGIHEIEIIGTFIPVDPSPAQYCGIVENYSKLYLPPLDQIQHGMKSTSVKCNEGLILLQKYDGTPACVTPETKSKLVERGWAKPDIRV